MRILMSETNWSDMALAQDLRRAGYLVTTAHDAEDMRHHTRTGQQDLILLSTDCAGGETLSLIRGLSFLGACPIVVTGNAMTSETRAQYFQAGADACLPQTIDVAELCARMVALVRRTAGYAMPRLKIGALCLDMTSKRATVDRRPMPLTRIEYELLEMLALRQGRLVRRDEILTHLYAFEDEPEARIIDVYICRIRARIAALGGDAALIHTHVGQGYRLAEPLEVELAA